MTTRDDITILLYQNINIEEIVEAKRNGTLLTYYSRIADRVINVTPNVTPVRTNGISNVPSDGRHIGIPPLSSSGMIPPRVSPETINTTGRQDRVRVSNL